MGDKRTGGVREIFGIDLPWLLDAFGPVKGVHAEKDRLSDLEIDYPDSYFITLRHENGTKGLLAVDVVSPKAVRSFECFGAGLHLFWEGNPKAVSYTHLDVYKRQGLYVVDPDVLDLIEPGAYTPFTDVVERVKAQGGRVGVYPVSEHSWMDMGQLEELDNMRRRLEEQSD